MRYIFTKRDVVFLRKKLAMGSELKLTEEKIGEERKDEERGKSHSNKSHIFSEWLKLEVRERWAVYSSRNTSLDSLLIVFCMCLSRAQLVRFMTVEDSK